MKVEEALRGRCGGKIRFNFLKSRRRERICMSSEQRCAQQQQCIEKGRGGVSPLCSLRNEEARPIF